MRVLIVVCRQTKMGSYHLPVGIGYVSACLKRAGHDVLMVNPNHSMEEFEPLLAAAIARHQPQVFATGGMAFHLNQVRELASMVRMLLPKATIVIGGPLVSNQPGVAMTAIPEADFGVLGEGEHTTVELLAALEAGGDVGAVKGLIYRSPANPALFKQTERRPVEKNLDSLPWVDYEGLGLDIYAGLHRPGQCAPALVVDHKTRVMPLMTSRGCPYDCTFCCHEAAGRRYRIRSLDQVFAEVEAAMGRYGINALFIYDDVFCLKPSRLEDFCQRVAKLGVRWECSMTASQINPAMLKTMKESGCCCISVGVESLSPTILKSMRKHTTLEELERVLPQIYDARIGLWSNLIFGDPAETLATVTESLEWFSNHPQYNFRVAYIGYHPGSRIFDEAVARGRINDVTAYLKSDQCEINATTMSDRDYLISRLLVGRAWMSFGFAGKLLALERDDKGCIVPRCLCPHCGAEGRCYTFELNPGACASINCPSCNRAYRAPVGVRLQASPEAEQLVAATRQLAQKPGVTAQELDAACKQILGLDPTSAFAWDMLIKVADAAGDRVTAARLLEQAIWFDPYNAALFGQMAKRLTELGLNAPRAKYVSKAQHLRAVGIAGTTYIDVVTSPTERKSVLDEQIRILNLHLPIASFLVGQAAPIAAATMSPSLLKVKPVAGAIMRLFSVEQERAASHE
ncbi:MAG: radical SAM protein [Burkholderiales bacterium]